MANKRDTWQALDRLTPEQKAELAEALKNAERILFSVGAPALGGYHDLMLRIGH